jgi:DNA-binding MarR family transcriptional regulator
MEVSAENCAADLMETVPIVMRFIRTEMRKHRGADLSVPQFRTLVFINRNPETSLSSVANHLGLTPPSTSVLVDSLVERGFVDKRPSPEDRRKVKLILLEKGKRILVSAQKAAHEKLAEKIKTTTLMDCQTISQAMEILRKTYSSESVS